MKYLIFLTISLNLHAANVLVLGDSHTAGPFGQYLDSELRLAGHSVGTYGSSSSVPGWFLDSTPSKWGIWSSDVNGKVSVVPFRTWGATPSFYEVAKQNPEVVIMAFGTNYVTKTKKFSVDDMKRFLKILQDAQIKCYWVAPPDTRTFRSQVQALFNMIQETVGSECRIFESHKITHYPETGGDGLHYGASSLLPQAKNWAKEVAKDFTSGF